jgi:hypothetical protein
MSSTICIPKDEYDKLKEDSKIVDALSKLDRYVVESITRSVRQAKDGKVRRIA